MARSVEPRTGAPAAGAPASGERIAKLLARAGVASRREVERMIDEGRVSLNGEALTTPATVLASLAGVTVDGEPVEAPTAARLFLYHKPAGLLVTERDPNGRPTIYDRLPPELPRVVPVGRLDLATEGLLLLTTDGGLKRALELPASGVERVYRARAYGPVTQAQLEALIDGVEIEGVRYGSIDANLERRTGANVWIELTLTEGKNREVRRVLEYLGLKVGRLIRTRYGPFVLADLPPGAVGEVRDADVADFRRALANKRPTGPERVSVAASGASRKRAIPAPNLLPGSKPLPGLRRDGAKPDSKADTNNHARRPQREPGLARAEKLLPGGKPLPGAGRGPVSVSSKAKVDARSTTARPSASHASESQPRRTTSGPSQLGPGLRRGGEKSEDREQATPRPLRPQRKPGWARAKPKPGARPPKSR